MSRTGIFARLNGWLRDNYGSRRGFVLTWWHRLRYLLGGYRSCRKVDWDSVERLVFVCKGNICRSAYAESVARSLGLEVASCGLQTIVAAPANEDAVKAARKRGVDLESHRTTPIMYLVLKKTDLLVAMEPWQVEYMKTYLMRDHHYTLLGLWYKPVLPHIQDPYGASPEYFERCFKYIEESVHVISKKIKESAS